MTCCIKWLKEVGQSFHVQTQLVSHNMKTGAKTYKHSVLPWNSTITTLSLPNLNHCTWYLRRIQVKDNGKLFFFQSFFWLLPSSVNRWSCSGGCHTQLMEAVTLVLKFLSCSKLFQSLHSDFNLKNSTQRHDTFYDVIHINFQKIRTQKKNYWQMKWHQCSLYNVMFYLEGSLPQQ